MRRTPLRRHCNDQDGGKYQQMAKHVKLVNRYNLSNIMWGKHGKTIINHPPVITINRWDKELKSLGP